MFGPSFLSENEVEFILWAPYQEKVTLRLNEEKYDMEKDEKGYFRITVNAKEGDKYSFIIDKGEIPDPASRYQPDGVHGRSQLVSLKYEWKSREVKIKPEDLIIYELHIGTFTQEGTFYSAVEKLDYLVDLGVTAIEIMPVHQFPGKKDWGYDGVYLYAVQNTYGGPYAFMKFIDEAHQRGLAVILDVVYNHVGPEGNYMMFLGPYFSQKYKTPWGLTFNFDDAYSDEVRKFILDNVRYWFEVFHIDGLRLDAVHAIYDFSPKHILQDIAELSHSLGKFVIAESDLNDPKIIDDKCGYKIDAQWVDDFHHSVHAYLTGERNSYYSDFGTLDDIVKAFKDVFVYDGKYSNFRKKTHGAPVGNLNACKFVVYIQDHDQVGNRGNGDRLSTLVDKQSYMIASALYLLSPFIPMIFMGEEYYERNPFLFFSDFSDPNLIKGVREGRLRENGQEIDPQSDEAFLKSKLSWNIDKEILEYYRTLIKIRKEFSNKCSRRIKVDKGDKWLVIGLEKIFLLVAFSDTELTSRHSGELLFSSSDFPKNIVSSKEIRVKKGIGIYKYSI
ncbi:malto-oligosyltrehalose trehalohydrolase [Sulfurisphaera ohwakuensis]|uniref:Malto-oligosyltrehalose trehalohydrolase n=1 Tax=Sulfurisphaera ohwakuensis TaxID=69656 RepID=A0A650CH90_SULOH|nr:malto-oligosyltrehalose trehalohydrolase [Sulfurisphaera ohwakuensis]MBB5252674.1 maltooligosyltrehalose trehalohydrolase [Sulfurisphaera ohwakuensis]QGR16897.1 malto-oligosyltrehalose trehalohydrolase [Sulfurisphaera ohwakuensis]